MKQLALALLAAAVFGGYASATEVGIKTIKVEAAHRGGAVKTLIWYPASAGGTEESVGDNPLFVGVPAMRDAPIAEGQLPLIVISHGSGGHAANLSWLADALAGAGFIVAAPNHPGTTSGDSRPAETVKIWERPADLSAVLDALQASPEWSNRIDKRHIGLAGFSLGGHSALATAGARVNAEAFAQYCDINTETLSDCPWYRKGGVDLHKLDARRFNQSNHDPRFSSVAAIDPALAQAYVPESLGALRLPTLIINLGAPGKISQGIDAAAVAELIDGASYRTIDDGFHMSFLGLCKPDGKEVLAAEGETDPLCDDGGGRSREAIHDEIAGMVVGFFKQTLTD